MVQVSVLLPQPYAMASTWETEYLCSHSLQPNAFPASGDRKEKRRMKTISLWRFNLIGLKFITGCLIRQCGVHAPSSTLIHNSFHLKIYVVNLTWTPNFGLHHYIKSDSSSDWGPALRRNFSEPRAYGKKYPTVGEVTAGSGSVFRRFWRKSSGLPLTASLRWSEGYRVVL